MIKLVLLNASDFLKVDSYPSLGIGSIKAYLLSKHKDISIKIFREDLIGNIRDFCPDILGINSENFNFPDAIDLARIIREEFPNIKIILGGPHITVLPKTLDKVFDCGVIGEGEETMDELVDLFKQNRFKTQYLKKVKGICYIDKNSKLHITPKRSFIKDINTLPHIDRSDFNNEKYAYVYCSRGCVFNCSYCSSSIVWGCRSIRLFSCEYLLSEFKTLIKMGFKNIRIEDEMFCISKDRLRDLVTTISSNKKVFKSNITFEVILTPNIASKEICDLLKKINIKRIKIGLYSASDEILKKNRNTSLLKMEQSFKLLQESKINFESTWTINSPDEKVQDLYKTFKFIKDNKISNFRLMLNRPYPGTYNWIFGLKKKIINKNFNYRLLDHEKEIEQISEFNFINLTKLSLIDLILWGKLINSLKKINNISPINLFINKIRNINKEKIIKKAGDFLYILGLKNIPQFPKQILINTNNSCNLHCDFCVVKSSRFKRGCKKYFLLKDVIKLIPDMVFYRPSIDISGGEPFLNKDLFKIIYVLSKNNINTNVITNGTFIKERFYELINSDIKAITISLDHYLEERHDKIRGVKGTYKKLMEGLLLLIDFKRKYGDLIKINLNTVINKDNYKDLIDIYNFIDKLGFINSWQVRHLTFNFNNDYFLSKKQKNNKNFPITDVVGMNYESNYFSLDQIITLTEQLKEIKKQSKTFNTKLVINPENVNVKKYYSNFYFPRKSNCRGASEGVTLWDGDVLTRCGYKIGDLNKMRSLSDLWIGNKNINFQKFIKKNEVLRCFRCIRRNFQ